MKKNDVAALLILLLMMLSPLAADAAKKKKIQKPVPTGSEFVVVRGHDLLKPNGEKLFIMGTNLGNWLNPEGYMFGFQRTNSAWMIDLMLRQMVGPDAADDFWKEFKDKYITRQDIDFIASQGANTIRLPFNYKLFTADDYMGKTAYDGGREGFERMDSVVSWCKANNLYLILDMHDCPGGQTGDNIDDGYGYPWLFESERAQQQLCDIWYQIALRYRDETTILGYEIMNEPIAHFFENKEELNQKLEPLYKRVTAAIRKADPNHIVILGGAQWNGNFDMFTDWTFDDKIIYSCHRYGGDSSQAAFQNLINFRDKTGLAMFMGETGHNTDQWQTEVATMLRQNNIGYTFWPYKKVDGSCWMAIERPAEWDSVVVKYSETPRGTFQEWREARPDQQKAKLLLRQFIDNLAFDKCKVQQSYIETLGLGKK